MLSVLSADGQTARRRRGLHEPGASHERLSVCVDFSSSRGFERLCFLSQSLRPLQTYVLMLRTAGLLLAKTVASFAGLRL